MTIEKEEIKRIKRDIDLVALIESKGITLKKNGKGYKGLCPFHDDKTPSLSVNPETNLWNCFGCNSGGDVIRFIELFDQVDFKEAVNRLTGNRLPVKDKSNATNRTTCITAKHIRLFNLVIEFYHTAFTEDLRARQYLNKRGITDNSLFADYKTGFANGTLLNVLPDDKEIKE